MPSPLRLALALALLAAPAAAAPPKPHKFNVAKCQAILDAGNEATRTLKAIMAGEKAAEEIARVKIPKGSVLEDNFEGVGIFRPRSSDDGFYRVLYKGQALWALECELDEESNEGTLFFDHNAQ